MSARPVGGNTIHRDLGMFKAALNWACQKHEGGQPPLTRHAMEKYKIPTEKDPNRPMAEGGTIRALLAVWPLLHAGAGVWSLSGWRAQPRERRACDAPRAVGGGTPARCSAISSRMKRRCAQWSSSSDPDAAALVGNR